MNFIRTMHLDRTKRHEKRPDPDLNWEDLAVSGFRDRRNTGLCDLGNMKTKHKVKDFLIFHR